jgi:hypothetical protein
MWRYNKEEIECIELLLDNKYTIAEHISQYKKDGKMMDDFLAYSKTNSTAKVFTINHDGDIVEEYEVPKSW